MYFKRIYILPLGLFILIPVTFLITYSVAVANEHVTPGFPYISDTGAYSPESCIFGQFLNIAAFILAICVYIKYLEVRYYADMVRSVVGIKPLLNNIGLLLGMLSCLGLDIVANFQETNVFTVHMIGAFMCFGSGTLYFLVQTWISYKMPELASRRLVVIRAVLVVISFLTTFTTIIPGIYSVNQSKVSDNPKPFGNWAPEDGGWELHLVSVISEWVLCVTYCVLILSFVPEFYDMEIIAPVIKVRKSLRVEKHGIEH